MNEETVQTLLATYVQVVINMWPSEDRAPRSNESDLPWRTICRAAGDETLACHEAARRANAMISLARDCASVRRPWKDCLKAMIASPDVSVETEPSRLRDAARVVLKAFQPPPNPTVVCGPVQVGKMLARGGYTREQIEALQDLHELVGD